MGNVSFSRYGSLISLIVSRDLFVNASLASYLANAWVCRVVRPSDDSHFYFAV